jgi:hypothetical protein
MDCLEKRLHRTWVQALLEYGFPELAAIAIDTDITIASKTYENFNEYVDIPEAIRLSVSLSSIDFFKVNDEIIKKIIFEVCEGNIYDSRGNLVKKDKLEVTFRIALIDAEEGWEKITRRLIIESQDPNQGVITEKAFAKRGQRPHIYNEMKFGSKSEIRIAQELESRKVLFFPLPLAVRCDTGNFYEDHREADFLVCNDGVWGVLEIAHHNGRYEKDKEKDAWFKKSGILCVEHYTAEKCFNTSKVVIDEFLEVLARYKR